LAFRARDSPEGRKIPRDRLVNAFEDQKRTQSLEKITGEEGKEIEEPMHDDV